jgi:hypothetical protein
MLTRIGLVDLALDQLGLDSSFQTKGRGWLNLVLEKLANNFNWDFYHKTASDVALLAGTYVYSVPADYGRPDKIYLIQNGSRGREIFTLDPSLFEQRRTSSQAGYPSIAKFTTDMTVSGPVSLITFDASQSGASFRQTYFRKPTPLSTTSADDTIIPDFLSQDVLMQELIKFGFENQDDERYPAKSQEVKESIRDFKFNQGTSNQSQVELATDVFRQGRGRRGSGWMGP